MSPISSRKMVPPSAASKSPFWSRWAPVKAPLTWPKSSLSSRVSVRAPQLSATKGWSLRGLRRVEGAGHQLLAGAALAGDEHGGGRVGHRVDHPLHLADGRRGAHQAVRRQPLALAELVLQLPVAVPQGLALGRLGHRAGHDLDVVEGLGEVVVGAALDRLERRLHGGVAGHHDDLDLRPAVLHRVEELEPGELGHLDVEEGDVEVLGGQLLGGRDGRVEPHHVVPLLLEQGLQGPQQGRLVVHDQHADGLQFGVAHGFSLQDSALRGRQLHHEAGALLGRATRGGWCRRAPRRSGSRWRGRGRCPGPRPWW